MNIMLVAAIVAGALAAPGSPSPVPSPSPTPLRTIANVKATPYCTALATHWNGIVQPMLENDRTLDSVSVSLDNVDTMFHKPDFASRFGNERLKLMKYVGDLQNSLTPMQDQINQLRRSETTTNDAAQRQEMHMLAQELQRSYDKQKQLATDLFGVVQTMMDFDVNSVDPMDASAQLEELRLPADMKSTKSYLRFNGQRDVIDDAESKAGDLAIDVATKYCVKVP
ncbi:MAG: hypothetical protein ACXVAK_00925 [Vulcanimicrobiaceae bacterium]